MDAFDKKKVTHSCAKKISIRNIGDSPYIYCKVVAKK